MREATTGVGIIPGVCVLIHAGDVWSVFPVGVYSGAFWGNGCNYRIAAIIAMFGIFDRL